MFIKHNNFYFNAKKVTSILAISEASNKVFVHFDNGESREFKFQSIDELKAFIEKITSAAE
ncbi:hypothetical protein F935_01552 [Acinetobacter calcoaceticus ANC 3811]|uniref:Uncharacterized protein n=1 Tax=Acinetobacter calcoaceticus ANC 3811 TaxID=1217690 RepID=R8Y8Y8_ACICA|nr:hypothetical protein [Acinetobacter calcoaceticus]EOQ63922.1 hypothetical protein F935_01552 [Acinetobacter calcoaceticus ANC 3811]